MIALQPKPDSLLRRIRCVNGAPGRPVVAAADQRPQRHHAIRISQFARATAIEHACTTCTALSSNAIVLTALIVTLADSIGHWSSKQTSVSDRSRNAVMLLIEHGLVCARYAHREPVALLLQERSTCRFIVSGLPHGKGGSGRDGGCVALLVDPGTQQFALLQ